MPRYLIERTYTVNMDSVPGVATRSKAIGHYRYPGDRLGAQPRVVDDDGIVEVVLRLRGADARRWSTSTPTSSASIRRRVYEIAGDVTPDDFPLTDRPGA